MKASTDTKLIAAVALAGLGLVWWITQRVSAAGGIGNLASGVASGAIQAVEGAAVGTVKGIGAVVGIPDTDAQTCRADLAAGRWWDASFSCPAGTYLAEAARAAVPSFGDPWASATAEQRALDAQRARYEFGLTDPRRVDRRELEAPADPLQTAYGMDFRYF